MGKALRLDKGQIEAVDDAMAMVLRKKSHAERIGIGFNIWLSARNMLTAHLKRSHPDWNEDMLQKEVSRRLSHGAV